MINSSDTGPLTGAPEIESSWFASLPLIIQKALQSIPVASHYYVALSGGLDSSLLLQLSNRYLRESRLASVIAIHVHHGISQYADQWQSHCEAICHQSGVELVVRKVELKSSKKGVEEAARAARYSVFEQILPSDAVLLQGHHQNDQAETVLLRLMRGAGVKGLAGIPKTRALNSALIHRPFLAVSRSELLSLAEAWGVSWVEDDSNASVDYDRNYIRHEVIPKLESRWESAVSRLAVSSEHCRESAELEEALAKIDLVGITQDVFGPALSIAGLTQLPLSRQRNAVRYWLQHQRLGFPGEKRFQRIWTELLTARADANPLVEWPLGAVRRYRDAIFGLSANDISAQSDCITSNIVVDGWSTSKTDSALSDGLTKRELMIFKQSVMGRQYALRMVDSVNASISDVVTETEEVNIQPVKRLLVKAPADQVQVSIKFRQGGELFKPVGRHHHKPLKKWLHECNVPPWLRDSIPLLYYNESLVAMGDLLVADGFQGGSNSRNLEISWGQKLDHNQL